MIEGNNEGNAILQNQVGCRVNLEKGGSAKPKMQLEITNGKNFIKSTNKKLYKEIRVEMSGYKVDKSKEQ